MTEDDVQKSNGIFFVDIDTILVPDDNDRGYLKRNIEEIRKNYLKYRIRNWERDEFLELSDDELVTMESWNRTWVENLELIIRGKKIRMVLLSRSHMDSDHIKTIAKFTGLYGFDEVLEYQYHEELINTVTG